MAVVITAVSVVGEWGFDGKYNEIDARKSIKVLLDLDKRKGILGYLNPYS